MHAFLAAHGHCRLVLGVFDEEGSDAAGLADSASDTSSSSSGSSSIQLGRSSGDGGGSDSCSASDVPGSTVRKASIAQRTEAAVALGKSGLLVQLEQQAQALRGEWEQHRQQLLQWVEEAEALLTAKQVGICVSLPRGLTTLLSPFVDVPWQRCGKAWCSWRTLSAVQCSTVQ